MKIRPLEVGAAKARRIGKTISKYLLEGSWVLNTKNRSNNVNCFGCISNCLECQVVKLWLAFHIVRCLSIAFRMVNTFRIQAVSATFLALPAAHKRA